MFLSAFLMTLIWHSHIADPWSCLMAGRNYSSCESDVRERKPRAPAWQPRQRKSTCFWINLQIKMIYCSSIISLEMLKSDSYMNSSIAPSSKFPFRALLKSESHNTGIKAETRVTCLSSRLHPRDATEHFDPRVSGLKQRPSQLSLVEPWTVSGHVSSLLSSHYLNVNKARVPQLHTTSTTHPFFCSLNGWSSGK